ncbi:helix-turn-helix transcriptional regulator [Holdemania massiliensis]
MLKPKGEHLMELNTKLKEARSHAGLTQEEVAEAIQVSRQTISNWETGKFYPDILSVIKLSDLYAISLDELLKGDKKMIEHLEESTDVVSSNRRLIAAVIVNVALMIILVTFNGLISNNRLLIGISAVIGILSTGVLFYQIIKKF